MYKRLLFIILLTVSIFSIYTVVGILGRSILLDSTKPFPSWTYNKPLFNLNTWTSWDSGFYYDLASQGYPKLDKKITVAYFDVPADSWLKVYLGSGLVGEQRFPLSFTTPFEKVNNTVFFIGKRNERVSVPIYNAYEGIGYCIFSGAIDYDRDVKVATEGLTNNTACGDSACDKAYVTYYDINANSVVYQESFAKDAPDTPALLMGTSRPSGFADRTYIGEGCRTITASDLSTVPQIAYDKQFTVYAFMPLYSYLSKFVSILGIDLVLAGLLISVVSYIVSGVFLYKFLREYFDEDTSVTSTLIYLVFPFAFLNLAFLPVGLFNMLLFMTLYFAKKGKVLIVPFLVCLLVYTHIYGFLVLIPLYFILNGKFDRFLMLVLIVTLAFSLYLYALYQQTGDWLLLINARKPWYGDGDSFVGGIFNYFIHLDIYSMVEVLVSASLVLLGYLGIKHINKQEFSGIYAMYVFALLFTGGLAGTFKYSLFLLPGFILLASFINKYPRLKLPLFILSFIFGAICMVLWSVSSRFVI